MFVTAGLEAAAARARGDRDRLAWELGGLCFCALSRAINRRRLHTRVLQIMFW